MRIGVAGMGRMGGAIAARLADKGHAPIVWNRTRARAEETGFRVADTPRALVEAVDVVITMLFDEVALESVFHGPDGLLSADLTGKLVIEMSTLRPGTQVALAAAVAARGGAGIECPVGGTVAPAREGRLLGMAGGAKDDVARARPVLDMLCRRVEHIGPSGAGASLKLAINLPLMVYWQAFGEANALVRHLDLDPAWLVEFFSDTAGASAVLQDRGQAIVATLGGQEPAEVTFDVISVCKDLRTMLDEAAMRRVNLPAAAEALTSFEEASREGWGDRDCTWLPARWAAKAAREEV